MRWKKFVALRYCMDTVTVFELFLRAKGRVDSTLKKVRRNWSCGHEKKWLTDRESS